MNPLILLKVKIRKFSYLLSECLAAVWFALEPLSLLTFILRIIETVSVDLAIFECPFVKFLAVMKLPIPYSMHLSL